MAELRILTKGLSTKNALVALKRNMVWSFATTMKVCVVWCGVVWCGVVWCGVVGCGVVWCGEVWCGGV